MKAPLTFKLTGKSRFVWRRVVGRAVSAIVLAFSTCVQPGWHAFAQETATAATSAPGSSGTGAVTSTGSGAAASAASGCGNSDSSGAPTCGQEAGNPINVTNGNKYQREVDMPALPGVLGLELIRHYNSSQSRLSDAPGLFGRGWRLSYDWNLRFNHSAGNETLVLVKGDGTEVGLAKKRTAKGWDGTWWPVGRPDGRLEEVRQRIRTQYLWTALNGTQYRFSDRGLLMTIAAPTGEVLNIEREGKGDITRVTDPQGRELRFELLSDSQAMRDKRFGGAQAVVTPLGRYEYRYGGEAPAASVVPSQRLLSRLLSVDHAGIRRAYLYEDADKPTLLTGIQVTGKGSDGVDMNVRVVTWAYDKQGRAFMSVRGGDNAAAAGGPPMQGTLAVDSLERVTLQFLPPRKDERGREMGTTILSNSLGQRTIYRFVKIQGRAELTEVIGPGCASCGETNVRNVYDSKGVLLEVMKLAPVAIDNSADAATAARVRGGEPLEGVYFSHDESGRPLRRERRTFVAGKAQPAIAEMRLEYAPASFPLNWMPVLIARPSVIEGKEHLTRISRNTFGQTLLVEESGFSPQGSVLVHRKVAYRYEEINGRSVLGQIDGPLPNGPKGSPEDSDITRFSWDSKASRVTGVLQPGGFRSGFAYDAAGRLTRREINDGFRKFASDLRYVQDGRHAHRLMRRILAGEIIVASPSAATRYARSQPFEAWFDALGRMTRQTDSAGREVHREYDASDRVAAIADALGNRSQHVFDGEGHMMRSGLYRAGQTALTRASYFWHDEHGRMKARLLPDGRLDTWTFDERGELSEHIDGDDVRSTFMRSRDGLVKASVRQASDGDIEWSIGRARRSPPGQDDFGRKVEVILPDHGNKQASYDEAGRIVEVRRADRSRIEFRYDLSGRLLRTRYLDSAGKVQSEASNRYEGLVLASLDDNELSTRYIDDALGRRLEQVVTIKALGTNYRFGHRLDESTGLPLAHTLADGRLLEVQRLSAREGRTVSALRLRPSWVNEVRSGMARILPENWLAWADAKLPSETVISGIEVDPLNGLRAFTMGNGIKTRRQFDAAGRLTQQTTDHLGTLKYGHKTGPRIREITTEPATGTSAQPDTAKPQTVRYDYTGFGQLKSPGAVETMQAAVHSQETPKAIKASPHAAFPRDALGRTTEDDRFRFSYTIAGQLSEVHSKADNRLIARYRYDSQSRRVSKTVFAKDGKSAPGVLYFLWQDQTLVGEVDAKGVVTTQYLYLKEGGPAQAGPGMPIAKLESKENQDNYSGEARLLYVHADHRGSPIAVSSSAGIVNLESHSGNDTFGSLVSQSQSRRSSLLGASKDAHTLFAAVKVGLPGQYIDAETGFRDNVHRTLDTLSGRFLQPDPTGYPDGPDPYLYAGGDKINRTDSSGLYEEDVHYYLTNFLALVAGLSPKQARVLALANRYIDDNPNTQPFTSLDARKFYHFTQIGFDPPAMPSEIIRTPASYIQNPDIGSVLVPESVSYSASYVRRRILDPSNPQIELLQDYAMAAPNPCAKTQLYGEFLHAFQDTFAHRDPNNAPYGPVGGHVLAPGFPGHDPDKTYDHVDSTNVSWMENNRRTKEMEKAVFKMLQSDFGVTSSVPWHEIEEVLDQFNSDPTPEDDAFKKAKVFSSILTKYNLPQLVRYDAENARRCRHANLAGLNQNSYPGTILNTPYLNVKEFKKQFQCI